MNLKNILNRLKNGNGGCGTASNVPTANDNNQIKQIWKVAVIVILGVGVALGCCDLDCVLLHFSDILGL